MMQFIPCWRGSLPNAHEATILSSVACLPRPNRVGELSLHESRDGGRLVKAKKAASRFAAAASGSRPS
jgi:hypothetical protein